MVANGARRAVGCSGMVMPSVTGRVLVNYNSAPGQRGKEFGVNVDLGRNVQNRGTMFFPPHLDPLTKLET